MTDGRRLWRLRKRHQQIDAALTVEPSDNAGGTGNVDVILQFLLGSEVMYMRRWPTRELAIQDATARRAELERQGWMPHW